LLLSLNIVTSTYRFLFNIDFSRGLVGRARARAKTSKNVRSTSIFKSIDLLGIEVGVGVGVGLVVS